MAVAMASLGVYGIGMPLLMLVLVLRTCNGADGVPRGEEIVETKSFSNVGLVFAFEAMLSLVSFH